MSVNDRYKVDITMNVMEFICHNIFILYFLHGLLCFNLFLEILLYYTKVEM